MEILSVMIRLAQEERISAQEKVSRKFLYGTVVGKGGGIARNPPWKFFWSYTPPRTLTKIFFFSESKAVLFQIVM